MKKETIKSVTVEFPLHYNIINQQKCVPSVRGIENGSAYISYAQKDIHQFQCETLKLFSFVHLNSQQNKRTFVDMPIQQAWFHIEHVQLSYT